MPGGVARLMKMILNVFWPPTGDSFMTGVTIHVRKTPIIVTGIFAGFLADEKAHKELTGTKGASGSKICITCHNVFNRVKDSALIPGTVCIACSDPGLFQYNTNASIYEAYDHIAANQHDPDLQQCLGLKYDPNGLLHDTHIRTIYKPVDHTLRDWQHTIVGGGVANVECARMLAALGAHRIGLDVVLNFLLQFKLPKVHGKVEASWLAKKRLGKKWKSLQSFSSPLLSLIPILAMFLFEVVDDPAHPIVWPHAVFLASSHDRWYPAAGAFECNATCRAPEATDPRTCRVVHQALSRSREAKIPPLVPCCGQHAVPWQIVIMFRDRAKA
jgi:hypothetical protein